MKNNYFFLACCFMAFKSFAQIPNSSFETWNNPDPANWETSNVNGGSVINVTQVTNAHAGSKAMRLQAWTYQGYVFSAVAVCPANGNFFPNVGQPLTITGWYISNLLGGDKVMVSAALQKNNTTISGASVTFSNTTSVYQQFSATFVYSNQQNSDSAAVTVGLFASNGGGVGLNPGSYVIVDDLQFGSSLPTGINENGNEKESESELLIGLNHSENSLKMIYSLPNESNVKIQLQDLTGKVIKDMLTTQQQAGTYRIIESTEGLDSGIYLVKLETGDKILVKKICVSR
jgi:hypothetical protein